MIPTAIWRLRLMNNVKIQSRKTPDTVEQFPVSSQRTLPPAPFPRKYVHSVFEDIKDAVEAVEQGRTFLDFLFSIDYDVYTQVARQGHHILAVRLFRHEQKEQVRDLLAPHHAYLMKYVDTWTMTDLLCARK